MSASLSWKVVMAAAHLLLSHCLTNPVTLLSCSCSVLLPPLQKRFPSSLHWLDVSSLAYDCPSLLLWLGCSEDAEHLQKHLEVVKAPLILLAGAWSTAPFYKNFILTFSSIVNYTNITKFDSILFGPFGNNCCTAPTARYQSILISGVHLQCDATGKLASPKMLFDELCHNLVFIGRLPLAAPCWLFNLDKLLTSDKTASSITFAFHDPTGEGLELMKRSHVGMFGKLVTIRSWETHPLLSQCTRCLQLGHTIERCR